MLGYILIMSQIVFFVVGIIFLFWAGIPIYAAQISLSSDISDIQEDTEVPIRVLFSVGAKDDTEYYLRGIFYKEDSSNYCGYTWSGSGWYNGPYSDNGWVNLQKIAVKDSTWSGVLKAKIDSHSNGCEVSGQYHFKVQRFTSTGSSSFDTQNDLVFNVTVPTPTATIVPTAMPTPTIKPTKVPTPTNIPVTTNFLTESPVLDNLATESSVLGTDDARISLHMVRPPAKKKPTLKPTLIAADRTVSVSFLGAGSLLLCGACGILGYRKWKNGS